MEDKPQQKKMLIVEDQENARHMLSIFFTQEGFEVSQAEDGKKALDMLNSESFRYVICDLMMPGMDGIELLQALGARTRDIIFILMTAYGNVNIALKSLSLGAKDYVQKPVKPEEILRRLKQADEREQLRQENERLKSQVIRELSFDNIVGRSNVMQAIFRTVEKVADYKTTVLLQGESGTGKELLARAIHANSNRRERAFVAVNCGAIPENLLESELFGHLKGAFTDALRTKKGLIEEAHEGTLFLDEIGELPVSLQVKLLRVLQEGEIRRVGDTKEIAVDIRIIAATARDLAEEVKEHRFREDLFYRLNVLTIRLPPLRERKEDIATLVEHFLGKYKTKLDMKDVEFTQDAMKAMLNYSWPGNVRELENTVERAMVLADGKEIDREALPERITGQGLGVTLDLPLSPEELSIKKTVKAVEKDLIRKALEKTGGNKTAAAKLLEISHRALIYKMKDYGIT
ncbi:MAG: sigma-54-dependent Fis family transcriptional regulator [Deltaproteobacteria bacterium]|nr:sigma-54-dependent Fis family transcriptional regulator [Deltaproteobacteria bacterium]